MQDFAGSTPRTGRLKGAAHPRAKLTDGDVALIRELYANGDGGFSYSQLAAKFDVAKATIADIVKERRR